MSILSSKKKICYNNDNACFDDFFLGMTNIIVRKKIKKNIQRIVERSFFFLSLLLRVAQVFGRMYAVLKRRWGIK